MENGASAKRGGEREAKRLLLTGVLLHVILLVYFKLSHQLPLGISFYTFQQIAWLTEVYHGELREVGAKDYLFYLFFFPKITMGPLTSPSALITQVQDEKRCSFRAENAAAGIQMFAFGLAKKAVLADTFGSAVTWGFSSPSTATSADVILVMFAVPRLIHTGLLEALAYLVNQMADEVYLCAAWRKPEGGGENLPEHDAGFPD